MLIKKSLRTPFYKFVIQVIGFVFLVTIDSFAYEIKYADTLSISPQSVLPWEIGFSSGLSRFVNTINPNRDAPFRKFNYWNVDSNPAYSLSVIKHFSPTLSGELEWVNTKLSGSWNVNNGYIVPPLAIAKGLAYPDPFETGINEFDFLLNVKQKWLTSFLTKNKSWDLFFRGGIGIDILKDDKSLYPFDHPRNKYTYSILYGGGLSILISTHLKIKVSAMMSRVTTEKLDGVREVKPDLSLKGTTPYYYYNVKEKYFHPSIGVTYTFVKKKKPLINIISTRDSVPQFMVRLALSPFTVKKTVPHLLVRFRPSIVGKVYNFYYGVGFGYDQSILTPEALVDIDKLAFELVTNPSVHAIIKGHTDSRGSTAYNMKLSGKRGQAVIDYLVKLGIDPSRLHNRPAGESQPVNKCTDGVKCTEEEHSLNRRTEILIIESEIKLDIEKEGRESIKVEATPGNQFIAEIQVGAFRTMESVEKAKKMLLLISGLPGIQVSSENKFYKVRIIGFKSKDQADKLLPIIHKKGFPDARLVEIKNP